MRIDINFEFSNNRGKNDNELHNDWIAVIRDGNIKPLIERKRKIIR